MKHTIELSQKELNMLYALVSIAQANAVYESNVFRKKNGKIKKSLEKRIDAIRPVYQKLTKRKYPNG
jgi:hypothetical protein